VGREKESGGRSTRAEMRRFERGYSSKGENPSYKEEHFSALGSLQPERGGFVGNTTVKLLLGKRGRRMLVIVEEGVTSRRSPLRTIRMPRSLLFREGGGAAPSFGRGRNTSDS